MNNSSEAHAEEISHEVTLFAEPIAFLGTFPVTNSLLTSWVAVAILGIGAYLLGRRLREIPGRFQHVIEIIFEKALEMMDSVTGSRKKSYQFFPLVFTFFLFILINNYLGLVPGVGSIGSVIEHNGGKQFIPFFRGATADLNTTLALSLIAVIATHTFGILMVGAKSHVNRFLNFHALTEIPKKIFKDPTILLVNPIKFFVGMVEIIGEIAKTLSLSLRLFGNIFAGEVLLASIAAIFAFFLPIPFIFLELIVGVVQALVFSMLTLVFLSILTTAEEH